MTHDLNEFIRRQMFFSKNTFGPGDRTKSAVAHVRKELAEIEAASTPQEALEEWIDVIILSLDQCWRLGFTAREICEELFTKQTTNMRRSWPDWRTLTPNDPIEHDRSKDA